MKNPAIEQATLIQLQAADPRSSVVLSAAAGSGKTKVLVDRFLRLCVEDSPARAHPRSILAITFTRKAAVEIQQRLLKEARRLALADAQEAQQLLQKLFGGREPSTSELQQAAGLYETLLEDLSALNVGTIHGFCQLILGRFAAEVGLDPQFTVIEDNTDLVEEALDRLQEQISRSSELSRASALLGKDPAAVRREIQSAQAQTMRLNRWLATKLTEPGDGALPTWNRQKLLPELLADLRRFLFPEINVDKDLSVLDFLPLIREAFARFLTTGLDQVHQEFPVPLDTTLAKASEKIQAKAAPLLAELDTMLADEGPGTPTRVRRAQDLVQRIELIFLTAKKETRKISTVKREGMGEIYNAAFCEQSLGLLSLFRLVSLLDLYHINAALLTLLVRFLDLMDELKRRDRVIDFQDLEDLACRLLADKGRALSLLHRLDDSLHHILLDEFQDTNFNQWDMLLHFVEEFLSGRQGDTAKSVFVVGDVKQSIYGFRAAEPELFALVDQKVRRMGQKSLTLPTNFRSTAAVVDSVGCVFNSPPLSQFYGEVERESARQEWARSQPEGEARVLPPFEAETDEAGGRSGHQLAAVAAARWVRSMIDGGATTFEWEGNRQVERQLNWGDVLILCRTRTEIGVYEKAFRAFGMPVVPAGRGMLAASREVQDILALLRWLAYPADDIALATVLRSPIFRFSEELFQNLLAKRDLFRKNRDGKVLPPFGLWVTLRKWKEDPELGPAAVLLSKWRDHVGRENSHSLLRRLFREGDILQRYEEAGGDQVRRNLVRLFDLALAPDVSSTPTVRHLSEVIERAAKRGSEEEAVVPEQEGQGRVRFMTIHGAKGLEAPVVLLVDADRKKKNRVEVMRLEAQNPSSPLLFKVKKAHTRGIVLRFEVIFPEHPLQEVARQAERRDDVESANLLYVAMTRAQDRLGILGGDGGGRGGHDSLLRQVWQSAENGNCSRISLDDPQGMERPPREPQDDEFSDQETLTSGDPSQGWLPPVMSQRFKIETPSSVGDEGGEKNQEMKTGEGDRFGAMERGNRVHLLLQLAAESGQVPPGQSAEHQEARSVVGNPDLDWVFFPERHAGRGLSEAAVISRRPGTKPQELETRITGSIDRLIIRDEQIDIIDYKTNRTGGETTRLNELVDHYRGQLESYREVMTKLYPKRTVRTWLLFTDPALVVAGEAAGCLKEVLPR